MRVSARRALDGVEIGERRRRSLARAREERFEPRFGGVGRAALIFVGERAALVETRRARQVPGARGELGAAAEDLRAERLRQRVEIGLKQLDRGARARMAAQIQI